jgi:hypothetical protein
MVKEKDSGTVNVYMILYTYLHHLHTELHTVYSGVLDNQLHEITPNFQLKV